MKIAPPIIGPLEFSGIKNNIILVEHDEEDCGIDLLSKVLSCRMNMVFTPNEFTKQSNWNSETTGVLLIDSIAKIHRCIKNIAVSLDFFVINRIDLMDLNFSKKEKGAQTKAYISMLCSKKILRDANVIVTSGKSEYTIREIASNYLNLRK